MNVVALFLKAPVLGMVKTRLAESLGDEGALMAYTDLVEFLLRRIVNSRIHVHHTPANPEPLRSWMGDTYPYIPQVGPGLGERLTHAMELEFEGGAKKLIFLGGDCPFVDQRRLDEAFSALDTHDLVVGPATDGGYYLIGMNKVLPQLFEGIEWGSDSVFQSTLDICSKENLETRLLTEESDVDDIDDWEAAKRFMDSP